MSSLNLLASLLLVWVQWTSWHRDLRYGRTTPSVWNDDYFSLLIVNCMRFEKSPYITYPGPPLRHNGNVLFQRAHDVADIKIWADWKPEGKGAYGCQKHNIVLDLCEAHNKGITWLFEGILFICARKWHYKGANKQYSRKSHVIIIIINKQGQMIDDFKHFFGNFQ